MSKKFEEYISQESAEEGLRLGHFASGVLRVNPKRVADAFCVTGVSDILIKGKHDRNRAFNSDNVVVEIFPESDWHRPDEQELELGISVPLEDHDDSPVAKNKGLIPVTNLAAIVPPFGVLKTGRVIFISKSSCEERTFACSLQPNFRHEGDELAVKIDDKMIKAIPIDKRIPWILIALNDHVRSALGLPGHLDPNVLYPIQVLKWNVNGALPLGRLKGIAYGRVGEPEVEAKVCLVEAGLEDHERDFSPEVHAEVEKLNLNFLADLELEAKRRIDLRTKRVFTIDPLTARDLDDAIHIDVINDEFVEIGVHIADVAHYVRQGSEVCFSPYLVYTQMMKSIQKIDNRVSNTMLKFTSASLIFLCVPCLFFVCA